MVLDIQSLVLLIVFIIVGLVTLICCIYCCACKPAWVNTRRRMLARQMIKDEEELEREHEISRAQIRETLTTNEQTRQDLRAKYNLK